MKTKLKCAQCNRELDVGKDVIRVDDGVMGMKGFVDLDHTLYFCSEECIKEYFDLSGLSSIPGRIP